MAGGRYGNGITDDAAARGRLGTSAGIQAEVSEYGRTRDKVKVRVGRARAVKETRADTRFRTRLGPINRPCPCDSLSNDEPLVVIIDEFRLRSALAATSCSLLRGNPV
jgi:hypothetical protein